MRVDNYDKDRHLGNFLVRLPVDVEQVKKEGHLHDVDYNIHPVGMMVCFWSLQR